MTVIYAGVWILAVLTVLLAALIVTALFVSHQDRTRARSHVQMYLERADGYQLDDAEGMDRIREAVADDLPPTHTRSQPWRL